MMPRAKKHLGQHFLHDKNVVHRILEILSPSANQTLLEIGPGYGALTLPLLQRCQYLEVVEIDADAIASLSETCRDHGRLTIHQGDVLAFDFSPTRDNFESDKPNRRRRLVGNLPYNISSAILFHLITYRDWIEDMHFMFQREVAERLVAREDTPDYGRLSVMAQYYFDIDLLFYVDRNSFSPPPKVQSAVVRLRPQRPVPFVAHDEQLFAEIVKRAFGQRRKTLHNALRDLVTKDDFSNAKIDPKRRGETLSVQEFVALANCSGESRRNAPTERE